MTLTEKYSFELPSNTDRASQIPFNNNFQKLEIELSKCALQSNLDLTNNKLATLESTVNANQIKIEQNSYNYIVADNLDASIIALNKYALKTDLDGYVTKDSFSQLEERVKTLEEA